VPFSAALSANPTQTLNRLTDTITESSFTENSLAPGRDFALCRIDGTCFVRCNLEKINFGQSSLRNVIFSECNLTEASFCAAIMVNVSFDDCIMERTDLSKVAAHHLRFYRVQHLTPSLTGASLTGSITFPETDLSDVVLAGAAASPDVSLPPGYRLSAYGRNATLDFHEGDALRPIVYDNDYLTRFASLPLVTLLTSKHHNLPVPRLTSILTSINTGPPAPGTPSARPPGS
jgi:hypothetical protein